MKVLKINILIQNVISRYTLLLAVLLYLSFGANAEVFTTKQAGKYSQKEVWTSGYPGNIIHEDDTVIIVNNLNYYIDIVVKGTLIIKDNGGLKGTKNILLLKSGKLFNLGPTIFGALSNQGVIYNENVLEVS